VGFSATLSFCNAIELCGPPLKFLKKFTAERVFLQEQRVQFSIQTNRTGSFIRPLQETDAGFCSAAVSCRSNAIFP
jgi:hypothetical protein